MATVTQLRLPPIKDEDLFEDFCLDLWSLIWDDPDAQKHGRNGQAQAGVDVYGMPAGKGGYEGVQCKAYANPLTDKQIQHEVDEARNFVPALLKLHIATTAPRDANSQAHVRQLNVAQRKAKLFTVVLHSWEDISKLVERHMAAVRPDLLEHYFHLTVSSAVVVEAIAEARDTVVSAVQDASGQAVAQMTKTIVDLLPASTPQDHYHQYLNHARSLVKAGKFAAALSYLEEFRSLHWHSVQADVRYRVEHYTATALHGLGRLEEAGRRYVSALPFNPDLAEAQASASLGYLLLGDTEHALVNAERCLAQDPANSRARLVAISAAPEGTPLDQIVESVPPPYRALPEVAHALGRRAMEAGDLSDAEQWMRTAIDNEKDAWGTPYAALASILLRNATAGFTSPSAFQLNPGRKRLISEAIDLMGRALERENADPPGKERAQYLMNRSIAFSLIGDIKAATADIDEALRILPDEPLYVERRAVLASDNEEFALAVELLQRNAKRPELPYASVTLAYALLAAGQVTEALSEAEKVLADPARAEFAREAGTIKIQSLIRLGRLDEAHALAEAMRAENAGIEELVFSSNVAREQEKFEESHAFSMEAYETVAEGATTREIYMVATALERDGDYARAIALFERIADTEADSEITQSLCRCYYNAGQLGKALALAQSLIGLYGPALPYSRIAASILEEIGDIAAAREAAASYLAIDPAHLGMRLRSAVLALRLGDEASVDAYLDENVGIANMSLNDAGNVVRLYAARGRSDRALDLAYELRRRHMEDSSAHLFYFNLLHDLEARKDPDWLAADKVAANVAVQTRDMDGRESWHIIEDRDDPHIPQELPLGHQLAQKLMGRSVGETVVLSQSELGTRSVVVSAVMSKYHRAAQEIASTYPSLFPDSTDMWEMRLATKEEGAEGELDFQPFFDFLSRHEERLVEADRLYSERNLPLATYARTTGLHPMTAFGRLMSRPEVGIRCASGNPAEFEAAVGLLSKPLTLVPDLVSLATLYQLDTRDSVTAEHGKFVIAQSTLDCIGAFVQERKGRAKTGSFAMGKEGDEFFRDVKTPEEVQRGVTFLEGFVEWIRNSSTVTPVLATLEHGRHYRKRWAEIMDDAFVDTALLASEPGRLLYSDDLAYRALVKSELGTDGVWTQVLLEHGRLKKTISDRQYMEATMGLSNGNYRHTYISWIVLLEAARAVSWHLGPPLTAILVRLEGGRCDDATAIGIAADTIYRLWLEPLLDHQRSFVFDALLDALVSGRNRTHVIAALAREIRRRFSLMPIQELEVALMLKMWLKGHQPGS